MVTFILWTSPTTSLQYFLPFFIMAVDINSYHYYHLLSVFSTRKRFHVKNIQTHCKKPKRKSRQRADHHHTLFLFPSSTHKVLFNVLSRVLCTFWRKIYFLLMLLQDRGSCWQFKLSLGRGRETPWFIKSLNLRCEIRHKSESGHTCQSESSHRTAVGLVTLGLRGL